MTNLSEPRIGEACAGYGGLGMGVRAVLGGEIAWVADNDPGAAKILARNFPRVPNHGDITVMDWAAAEPVDIFCTGFPCTDVSTAGFRAGLRAGTRSGAWVHCAYGISVLRPQLVVIENVKGLLSAGADSDMEPCPWCLGDAGDEHSLRAAGAVCGDLASLGYDTRWAVVSAADAGAVHLRERIFILAWPAAADALSDTVQRWGVPGVLGGPEQAPAGVVVERQAPKRQRQWDGDTAADQDQAAFEGSPDWWHGEHAAAFRHWEAIVGRPAPQPADPDDPADRLRREFTEWMMGLPEGWVTGVPGLSKQAQGKALGNGCVPQQVALAVRLLLGATQDVLWKTPA